MCTTKLQKFTKRSLTKEEKEFINKEIKKLDIDGAYNTDDDKIVLTRKDKIVKVIPDDDSHLWNIWYWSLFKN